MAIIKSAPIYFIIKYYCILGMAATRIGNDRDRQEFNQNFYHNSLGYMINVPGNGVKPDYIEDPHIRLQKFGANISANIIDIDSKLKGVNYTLTRDINDINDINSKRDPDFDDKYMRHTYPTINNAITDETRATMPAWQVRDLEQNNWDYLPSNPQAHTEITFMHNIDSRNLEKDKGVPICPPPALY